MTPLEIQLLPKAASAWIQDKSTGLVLAVSRKHDPTDLGLPGGKLDPGEAFDEAVIRETAEEVNLRVVACMPIYYAACGNPGIHNVHACMAFFCLAEGVVAQREAGRVVWVKPERLFYKPDGAPNSFCEYNKAVYNIVQRLSTDALRFFCSEVPITKEYSYEC